MEGKTITLVSSDGEKMQIAAKAAQRSQLVKGIIEDYPDDAEVPFPVFLLCRLVVFRIR